MKSARRLFFMPWTSTQVDTYYAVAQHTGGNDPQYRLQLPKKSHGNGMYVS